MSTAPEPPSAPPVPPGSDLAQLLRALGDPHRLAMLRILADGSWHPCGAGDWSAGLHKSTVSHHIKTLREAGLFEAEQRGRTKYGRLCREDVDRRFPGLLDGVLANI